MRLSAVFYTLLVALCATAPLQGKPLFVGLSLPHDPTIQTLVDSVSVDTLMKYVRKLERFGTRRTLTDSCRSAASWIRDIYSFSGYHVDIDSFWVDSLWIGHNYNLHAAGYDQSVIAVSPGIFDSSLVYIISGHYDSINGVDTPNSFDDPYAPAPGANDDGTGVACVMECARIFKNQNWKSTIKFAAFGDEEYSPGGAAHYATQAKINGQKIRSMTDCDCVGFDSLSPMGLYLCYTGEPNYERYQLYHDVAALYSPSLNVDSFYFAPGDSDFHSANDYPFAYFGYPTISLQGVDAAYYGNHYMHSSRDSSKLVDSVYLASVCKSAAAFTAICCQYPSIVLPVVQDSGDGAHLRVSWPANDKSDIALYRVYYGHVPGVFDSVTTTSLSCLLSGLMEDSMYHIAVRAFDADGHPSPLAYDITGTPHATPSTPANVVATPIANGVRVDWNRNAELDVAGYALCRRINAGTSDSLTVLSDTTFLDQPLSGANKYYYTVTAYDRDGNRSAPSSEVYSRPFTLNQGILVVDETYNWTTGNYPRDTTQDKYWDTLLVGYAHEQYEFGNISQKPVLADFAPYSTVLWHGDDRTDFLAANDTADLRKYLTSGGKLWLVGWEPLADVRNNATYPTSFVAGSFIYDYLKVSQASLSSATADTFIAARGHVGYPDVTVDSAKVPLAGWKGTMRFIEGLTPVSPAEAIYTIDMKNNGSPFEGLTCGIRYLGSDYKLVYCGYPLYFMKQAEARALAVQVMNDFGETGVAGKPEDRTVSYTMKLETGHPNPFKRSTTISYQLAKAGRVELCVYNIAGQRVRTLVEGNRTSGMHAVTWDGRNDTGHALAAGVYLVRMSTAGSSRTAKITLVR